MDMTTLMWILGIVGVLIFVFALVGKPKKKDATMAFGLVLIVVAGLIYVAGGGLAGLSIASTGVTVPQQVVGECQTTSTGKQTINVAVQNPLSATLDYNANELVATYDGIIDATGTAKAGTSLNYTELSLTQCKQGTLYALGSATYTGAKTTYNSNTPASVIIKAPDAGRLQILTRNSALTDIGGNSTGSSQTGYAYTAYTATQTMSAGSVLEGYIDISINASNAQFGSTDGGIIIAVSLPTSKFSVNNGFTLTSNTAGFALTKLDTIPSRVGSFDGAVQQAYKIQALKSGDGVVRLNFKLVADIGDPTSSDKPIVYFHDVDYFMDDNGAISLDAFSAGGTNVGQTDSTLTFNLA